MKVLETLSYRYIHIYIPILPPQHLNFRRLIPIGLDHQPDFVYSPISTLKEHKKQHKKCRHDSSGHDVL